MLNVPKCGLFFCSLNMCEKLELKSRKKQTKNESKTNKLKRKSNEQELEKGKNIVIYYMNKPNTIIYKNEKSIRLFLCIHFFPFISSFDNFKIHTRLDPTFSFSNLIYYISILLIEYVWNILYQHAYSFPLFFGLQKGF